MFALAREVWVCACATDVRPANQPNPVERDLAERPGLVVRVAGAAELARLATQEGLHDAATLAEYRARLAAGEAWVVAELDGAIVSYTFVSTASRFDYPSLPGCAFSLRGDVGYGHGAWTAPAARGRGHRRAVFAAELALLRARGKRWEASVFSAAQLEPATRSLAAVGIVVEPLYRVRYERDRRLAVERLVADDRVTPACL